MAAPDAAALCGGGREARGWEQQNGLRSLRSRGRLRGVLALLGPAFVAAVAYVDPGNFATNFSAGAQFGYGLAWVVVVANLMAMLVQYLSAKVGVATGQDLPELCRDRLPRPVSPGLWVQAELVAMATDLAEFVGAAIGLNLLFGLPLLAAGLVTAVVAFGILAMEQRGYRRFELAIAALLGLVFLGFAYDLATVGASAAGVAAGLVPSFGSSRLLLVAGIIGATVMPHVVYLHSALTKSRVSCANDAERRHPDQHYSPLRSTEPGPVTDTLRTGLTPTTGQPPGELGQWIKDLVAAHRTFAERLADWQSVRIPAEDPAYGDLGQALPLWPGPGRDAILQAPKPEIRPSPYVLERAADRDTDWEAGD